MISRFHWGKIVVFLFYALLWNLQLSRRKSVRSVGIYLAGWTGLELAASAVVGRKSHTNLTPQNHSQVIEFTGDSPIETTQCDQSLYSNIRANGPSLLTSIGVKLWYWKNPLCDQCQSRSKCLATLSLAEKTRSKSTKTGPKHQGGKPCKPQIYRPCLKNFFTE